jgi:aflatoxin B1 aldehyde reductase
VLLDPSDRFGRMRMTMNLPRLYFGTMTFGWSQTSSYVDESVAFDMLKLFLDNSPGSDDKNQENVLSKAIHIDTARIYAGGKTEVILGNVLAEHQRQSSAKSERDNQGNIRLYPKTLSIGSKAHPSYSVDGLSPRGIHTQLQDSLQALQLDRLGEFYLHQPDPNHPLELSLQELHSLVLNNDGDNLQGSGGGGGFIQTIGMSNYHASEMERAFQLCEQNNWTKPKVYQGLYNPLNRHVEKELLPTLRNGACSFVAYNPLAGGLLTGKYTEKIKDNMANPDIDNRDAVPQGRFRDNPNYLPRFYTGPNFQAIAILQNACDNNQISMVEASYRWLLCHSSLGPNDGILIGASSLIQLDENLRACRAAIKHGPLPEDILEAFDDAWTITQETAFPYWRSYSSDMPNRDNLDPGAAYEAKK